LCTVRSFFPTIYCKKRPRDHGGKPTWKNPAKHLNRRTQGPRSCLCALPAGPGSAPEGHNTCCPPPGQAPASHSLPSPPSLAGKGSADAKGSRRSLAYSLRLWSLGPMPGSLLPCPRVTRRHLPEEMLGGQGWPQSFGPPQVLQHGQPGVTTASVVEKGGPF